MDAASSHNVYAFRNSSDQAPVQLSHLARFLDPVSTASLAPAAAPGATCLELGPGAGTVAYWLADRVGESGRVTAVDINPVHVEPRPNLEVIQHDLREGLPVKGPFDVIHARLVLSHIAERADIVESLVEALAPGGLLVIGEFVRDPVRVIAADSPEDAALYVTVSDAIYDGLIGLHGADLRFGFDVFNRLTAAGLESVHATEFAESWIGGSGGAQFLYSNSFQLEHLIRAGGVDDAGLAAYRRLVFAPGLAVKSNLFVNTVGRKPTA